jgi:hypothetical protein
MPNQRLADHITGIGLRQVPRRFQWHSDASREGAKEGKKFNSFNGLLSSRPGRVSG